LKNSLDEECFKILEPKDYRNILKQLKALEISRDAFLANAKVEIIKVIGGEIKNCEIDFRVKSIYSIYKKLNKKGLTDISHLYDIFGIRIIVHDLSECYRTL
jgi:GTP pyrophosphokinase